MLQKYRVPPNRGTKETKSPHLPSKDTSGPRVPFNLAMLSGYCPILRVEKLRLGEPANVHSQVCA